MGRPSGTAEAGCGSTARVMKESIQSKDQLKDKLALRTMASVSFMSIYRMVAAKLQIHDKPLTENGCNKQRASMGVALRQRIHGR